MKTPADALALIGRGARAVCAGCGAAAVDVGRAVAALPRLDLRELWRGLREFGWGSLPLTFGMAILAGATVVAQTAIYVQRFGARTQLGWAAGYAVIWEFAPLLLAVMMGARVGARNAAELASLSIGGQIEGLRGISLNPFAVLVAPRMVSIVASLGLLYIVAALVSVLFEALTAFFALRLPVRVFFSDFEVSLSSQDVLGGLTKSLVFGACIAVVSTTLGLRARGGARAVGNAAASAVVWASAAIVAVDFFVTTGLLKVLG
jgi:phospholipid/cholesterol/gamma-HCH transport system permease protein